MNKPILYLIFNRLDYVKKSFQAIRRAKPPRLYISSDAARLHIDGENDLVEEVRNWVFANIDWNCEVKTRYNSINEGSALLNNAITWFFENEEDGIILEDDVLPSNSFFIFCEELLDRYKDNKNVWNISGQQFAPNKKTKYTYIFGFPDMCAWATWADRWQYYENDLSFYKENYIFSFLKEQSSLVKNYWINILNSIKNNKFNDWDYKWTFTIMKHNGISINPSQNLSTNFGIIGTHFNNELDCPILNVPFVEIDRIVHPKHIILDQEAMRKTFEMSFGIKPYSFKKRIKLLILLMGNKIKKLG